MLGVIATLGTAVLATTAAPAPTVAILYFDYQGKSEEMGLLRKGLAQMLISDLTDRPGYRLVERDRLEAILDELKLGRSAKMDKKTANRIGKLLGARYLVLGGYFDLLGTLRVDARVVEVETGKVVKSVGAQGKPDDFLEIEQTLANGLGKILESRLTVATSSKPKRTRRRRRPKKLKMKTALRYARALDAKDRGDKKTAEKEMRSVLKEEPQFAIAQADLDALLQ